MVARKHRPTTGLASANGGVDDETNSYYRKIMESNRLGADSRREIEIFLREKAKEDSLLDRVRESAARQARKTYVCDGCGLEFLGILAFAEHDEETSHMSMRGRKVEVDGNL
jgi:hypothetical protein